MPGDPGDGPNEPAPADPDANTLLFQLDILTYNVAGLPEPLSGSKPAEYTEQISPLLNAYPLVLVQEDFAYHDDLSGDALHPYQSEPSEKGLDTSLGDGLNRFSDSPFADFQREAWEECSGTILGANDCLTPKGFSVATHTIAGVEVDIYNLHMDAGQGTKDRDARAAQSAQLARKINSRSAGRPLIIAGDTNMHEGLDDQVLADFLAEAGITDACQALDCGEPERIDRVFVRGTDELRWDVVAWSVDPRFVTDQSEPLSDHEAVAVSLALRREP